MKIVISIEKALKLKDEISTTIQNHVNIMIYGKLRFFDEFSIAKQIRSPPIPMDIVFIMHNLGK